MDNEMILTFMISKAQAEKESLSGSVKWGHRKNFKDGKVYYHYASFLGYRKGPDGLQEIDPDEAAIARRIFARYLMGQSAHQICRDLMSDGVKTAVTAAMNELFHAQTAKEALEASITAALAGENRDLSLSALETQIRSLQERQLELFQLAVSAGPDCLD